MTTPENHQLLTKKPKLNKGTKAVLLFMLTLVIAIAACEIAGWPFLRTPVEKFLNAKLERVVRLDAPFKLHLLGSIKLEIGGLYIAAPSGFDAPYLVDAKNTA